MNRWRMHKLGFVNFWLHDVEEFLLEDGHILLRGANASGKSITTQSFIPFLLDGDRSPERLDPFGSRDRKMEFYLLGEGEREESIGYLYLEFKKDGLEQYLTIGVGQRAQKGKGMDFWGFCLCDGRRIGVDNFQLYETVGHQMLPLSKQKLKNLIGDPNNWVDSTGGYKQLVNDRVFGFRDIRQYEQLIQLLIKVRAPKLSKEAFRPSEVKKILKESLPTLTDEDLSAMVSTMERMDALEDTLRDYRAAMRDAGVIRNEYTRYNQFILGMKGKAYHAAATRRQRLHNQLEDARQILETRRAELDKQRQLKEQAEKLWNQVKAQRAAMGDDDIAAKRNLLTGELETRDRLKEQMADDDAQLNGIRQNVEQKEVDLRTHTRQLDDSRQSLSANIRQLNGHNEILALGDEHNQYVDAIKAERLGDSEQSNIRMACSRRKRQIGDMLNCLRKVKEAYADYDAACHALDQAETELAQARSELRHAEQLEQEERDRLMEAITRQQTLNEELRFSDEELLSLRQAVTRYRSPADWSSVNELVTGCYQDHYSRLIGQRVEASRTMEDCQRETEEIRRELDAVRRFPEPIPPRSKQIEATRIFLLMRDIPHAAFYETVDFRPGLSQEAKDLLEAQLTDAGLLDALVVPESHRAQIEDILAQYPDRFLIPGVPTPDPITDLIPDAGNHLHATAARCLAGISGSDMDGHTVLLPDGRFRNGMLRGHSQPIGPAGYVGATARRANRDRQIHVLEARLTEAEEKQRRQRDAVDLLDYRLTLLKEERDSMPITEELDQALDMLKLSGQKVSAAQAETEKRSGQEKEAKLRMTQLQQESRDLSVGLPFSRTIEAYEEALDAAEEYADLLHTISDNWNKLRYTISKVEDLTSDIAQRYDDVAALQLRIARQRDTLEVTVARIRELEAFWGRPENQARAQRLAQLDEEIKSQNEQFQDAHDECIRLDGLIQNAQQVADRQNEEMLSATFEEHELERYFSEDLTLNLVQTREDGGLLQSARQAESKIRASDRENTSEKVGEALRNNYQQHNNSLLRYQPKIETVFDPPTQMGMLRQRLLITLQKEGKQLSLYEFMQGLQKDIDITEMVLEEKDRELFEDILTDTISHKLRARIEESQQWSVNMSALMKTLDTSMGLTFSLDWKSKKAQGEQELDTAQLVMLLNKDRALLTREDSKKVSAHFRARVNAARENAEVQNQSLNYADLIREVLDYRTWYDFQIYYQREGEAKKELTDRIFNKFSGGEKAMAMYLPQFAAVSAQYQKGGSVCPMLLALDEAFAGVDDKNIGAMFELVSVLGFDYIMNSQSLWGCYSCVSSLDIAEFHRPANARVVTILRYRWNGIERRLLEE